MRNIGPSVKCMMIAVVVGLISGVASHAAAKPLKVFILAGQSNMQGHVNVSTFDSMADDPKTAPILKEMRDVNGKPRVCENVWISSIGCTGNDTTEQKGKLTAGFVRERRDRQGLCRGNGKVADAPATAETMKCSRTKAKQLSNLKESKQ